MQQLENSLDNDNFLLIDTNTKGIIFYKKLMRRQCIGYE